MPRDIPVGNGNLLITFDRDYCLRDVYYPYVGKENHTDGHKFRFGVWVDGTFSWVSRQDWDLRLEYAQESLLTHVTAINRKLDVHLHCNDVVDFKENIYIKTVLVRNLGSRERGSAPLCFSFDLEPCGGGNNDHRLSFEA
jgi:GH15 family glucan-1,4-alpha-glucosidase